MEKSAKALVIRALSDSLASLASVFNGPRIFARMTRRFGEHAPRCHEAVAFPVDGFLQVDGLGLSDQVIHLSVWAIDSHRASGFKSEVYPQKPH